MNRIAALFAILHLALLSAPVFAQGLSFGNQGSVRTVVTESWIEEWDTVTGQWVRVADDASEAAQNLATVKTSYRNGMLIEETREATRYAQRVARPARMGILAQYGPFAVTSPTSAMMIGPTDSASPEQFDAMLRDFPALRQLDMLEAPGTSNDIANLAVGRRIRAAGIATHVPHGGSVRSGAVELFLAGATRTMADSAQFAVHSWLDNYGREADDFAADHPAHRLYLDYYVEMGMTETQARNFYAMTNSVPHDSALWLGASDMRPWLANDRAPAIDPFVIDRIAQSTAIIALARPGAPQLELDWQPMVARALVPVLDYGDLETINLAQLDASVVDSRAAFP